QELRNYISLFKPEKIFRVSYFNDDFMQIYTRVYLANDKSVKYKLTNIKIGKNYLVIKKDHEELIDINLMFDIYNLHLDLKNMYMIYLHRLNCDRINPEYAKIKILKYLNDYYKEYNRDHLVKKLYYDLRFNC